MRLGLLYISVAQSSFESQISFVTLRVQRSVCINLYNIKKKLSDPPSLLCQIYADPPFLGRQKVNDPPLNSSGPPPLLKNECSLRLSEIVPVSNARLILFCETNETKYVGEEKNCLLSRAATHEIIPRLIVETASDSVDSTLYPRNHNRSAAKRACLLIAWLF